MIEFLSSWAGQIAVSVILVTILEGIVPEGKNKKYIKVVTGVYILFVILSPIVSKISGQEIDIEKILSEANILTESSSEVVNLDTSSSIKETYLSNLKTDISNKLKQRGYEVLQADFNVELEDETNYGKIYKINLKLQKADTVKKIEINIGNNVENKKENLPSSEIKELKEYLSNIYDLKKEDIIIS